MGTLVNGPSDLGRLVRVPGGELGVLVAVDPNRVRLDSGPVVTVGEPCFCFTYPYSHQTRTVTS